MGIFPKSAICGTFLLAFFLKKLNTNPYSVLQCIPSHPILSNAYPLYFPKLYFFTRAHLQGRKEAGPGPAKVQRSAGLLSYRGGVFFHSCSSRNSKHDFPLQALQEIFMVVSNLLKLNRIMNFYFTFTSMLYFHFPITTFTFQTF